MSENELKSFMDFLFTLEKFGAYKDVGIRISINRDTREICGLVQLMHGGAVSYCSLNEDIFGYLREMM